MTLPIISDHGPVCFNCGGSQLRTRFDDVPGVASGRYRIVQCDACALAFIQTQGVVHVDYSEYGDHLAMQDATYYTARARRMSAPKRALFGYLERRYGLGARILDFGGGAGFFVRSCLNYGFRDVYLLEPSRKLRGIAEEKLGLDPRITAGNIDELDVEFDVIVMLDVIEHLPVDAFDSIMRGIARHLKPGGILLGTTPNLDSLNIRLSGTRDPAIAPPQHTVYFTRTSLDVYLRKLGLRRALLIATGLSTNSFFRREKFAPSWVERPRGWRRPIALAIRGMFGVIGAGLTLLGNGYGMYFVYERTAAPNAPR